MPIDVHRVDDICPTCHGLGVVTTYPFPPPSQGQQGAEQWCPVCGGLGTVAAFVPRGRNGKTAR